MASKSGKVTAQASFLSTVMCPWKEVREMAEEDLAAPITNWTNDYEFPTVDAAYTVFDLYEQFGDSFQGVVLAFYGDKVGANSPEAGTPDTFGFDLLGYRAGPGGPPMVICATAAAGCAIGTMEIDYDPIDGATARANALWCDTIALSYSDSPGQPTVYDSGNDRMALLAFDAIGIRRILVITNTSAGGTAGECPGVRVLGTVY